MHTMHALLISALLAAISIAHAHTTHAPASLTPSAASAILHATPNGDPAIVTVDLLMPHQSYELRVNYIGTVWLHIILNQSVQADCIV
jgi:hypothetical protein